MKFKLIVISVFVVATTLFGCKKKGVVAQYDATPYNWNIINSTLPVPNLPTDNSLTNQKVMLGNAIL